VTDENRIRESGIGSRDKHEIPKVIARAKPMAIYDFLFLFYPEAGFLNPESPES
jgi:hypothetical protein